MPERNGGHDSSGDRPQSSGPGGTPDTPQTEMIAAPDSWKTGVPEGTAGAAPAGPLRRLGVGPAAAALGRPADQRRLRERSEHRTDGGSGHVPDDPPDGGVG